MSLELGIGISLVVMTIIWFLFPRFDKWMCLSFPHLTLRLWWCRLWIRRDESHPSLNMDADILLSLPEEEQEQYHNDLNFRRILAHEREKMRFQIL